MCGRVGFVARFPSRFVAHCHCESCRRAHSAAFVTWVGLHVDAGVVSRGGEEDIAAARVLARHVPQVLSRVRHQAVLRGREVAGRNACRARGVRRPGGSGAGGPRVLQGTRRAGCPRCATRRSRDPANGVTGIVLAGGQGRRMGGVDKGLVELDGRPMVAHVLARLAPQVGDVLINANQNRRPLRGVRLPGRPRCRRRLRRAARGTARRHDAPRRSPYVVTVPCDSPFLPLRSRCAARARPRSAVARSSPSRRPSTSRILSSRSCAATCCRISPLPRGGGRKIDAWYATLAVVEVAFDDEADAFRNINTAEELAAAARTLTSSSRRLELSP